MNSGDLLLYVISTKREMSWPAFKRLFDSVAAREIVSYDNASIARSILLRHLDGLGHCELLSDTDELRIVATPTSLVRLPTAKCLAVLSGSRSPDSLEILRKVGGNREVSIESTPHFGDLAPLLPEKVLLSAPTDTVMDNLAKILGIPFTSTPAGYNLACMSGTLAEIESSLQWKSVPELDWSPADFDPEYNCFVPKGTDRRRVRLTRYLNPITNVFRYYMWNDEMCAPIDSYWGRYLAMQKSGYPVFYFDDERHLLALPKTLPLPRLVARAVTLCSGSAPRILRSKSKNRNLDLAIYELVPRQIAELIAGKLGQALFVSHLDVRSKVA